MPSILCYSWVCGPDPSPVVWAKLHTALDSVLKPSHVRRLLGLACEDELALLYRAWIAPTGQTNSYKPILTRMYIKDPRESRRPVSHHESRPMLVQLCHQQVVVLGWGESVEMPKQQEKAVLHWEALWHCGCVGTTLSRRHSRNGGSRGRSADEGRRVAAGPGARKLACQKGGWGAVAIATWPMRMQGSWTGTRGNVMATDMSLHDPRAARRPAHCAATEARPGLPQRCQLPLGR